LAAEIRKRYGVDSELVAGSGGVFDVTVDDDILFSKHEEGRFPTNDEVLRLMDERLS
jgi:selenoprotein W-related protein